MLSQNQTPGVHSETASGRGSSPGEIDHKPEVLVENKKWEIFTRNRVLAVILILFLVGVIISILVINKERILSSNAGQLLFPKQTSEWGVYVDKDLGFEFKYPPNTVLIKDKVKMSSLGYLPICDKDVSTVCIYYPGEEYQGSVFEGAGVSINLLSEETTEEDCLTFSRENGEFLGNILINGVNFNINVDQKVSLGHTKDGRLHTVFHQGKCFVITSRINTVSSGYSPQGTRELSPVEKWQLRSLLKSIVFTFIFLP